MIYYYDKSMCPVVLIGKEVKTEKYKLIQRLEGNIDLIGYYL